MDHLDARVSGRPERFRVVVADDEVLLRHALGSLVDRLGFEVVGLAGTAEELLALVRSQQPDLVIVDIRMPPGYRTEGLDAARIIRQERPQTAILVLSGHVEVEHAMDLLATERRIGYRLKDRVIDIAEFRATLERLIGGEVVIEPALVQELVRQRAGHDPLEALSPREREVLALMAEGRSNGGIANKIWVAERTVEKHVRSILTKLRLPESSDDHRRVLAVLTFLDRRERVAG
ncbi:response regulator transcription factor [Jatrophihabitans sp. DSM 45814]